MKFTTKVPILKSINPIDYNSKIMSLGSCFAVNMGEKFDYFQFQNTTNPFGIIFNPLSIEKLIRKVVSQEFFAEEDVFFRNERWHCFDVHSDHSNPNKAELLANLNAIIVSTYSKLQVSSHVIITYGTSWVYRNKQSNSIVANCHKVPQKEFEKELLSIEEISSAIQSTINLIQSINPNCGFIFTVSPVRHLKDGFIENQVSKAHLLSAIYKEVKSPEGVSHLGVRGLFPSYEIMMDELRDYRFYADDMIHPSAMAIDYIWERFVEAHISVESYSIMEEVETIQKGLSHRPFNSASTAHLAFLANLEKKIIQLQSKYNHITF